MRVFLTGVTGFIGGTLAAQVLPTLKDGDTLRVLVRTAENATKVTTWAKTLKTKQVKVEPVIGSLDDEGLIAKETAEADAVLDAADTDHAVATKAFLQGAQKSADSGKRTVIIHTSGGFIASDITNMEEGKRLNPNTFDDSDPDLLAKLPPKHLHKEVDEAYFDLAKKNSGKVDVAVVAPCLIWGIGTGPGKYRSFQIPYTVEGALRTGRAFHPGKGVNAMNHVNVLDLASLYVFLMYKLLDQPGKHSGYYFPTSEEFEIRQLTGTVQSVMVRLGRSDDPTPRDTTNEDLASLLPPGHLELALLLFGASPRLRSSRAGKLGWKPQYTNRDSFFNFIVTETLWQAAIARTEQKK